MCCCSAGAEQICGRCQWESSDSLTFQSGLPRLCACTPVSMGDAPAGETLLLRRRAMSCAAGLAVAVRALRCCASSDSFMEKDPSAGRAPIVANLTQDKNPLGMKMGLEIV